MTPLVYAVTPRVYVIVGADGSVRGFAYVSERYAREAIAECDELWPAAAPHRVVAFEAVQT